ncbi:MAG: Hsp20/alpha crystallin family protein [Candidatus Latescibacterota bacterium]|nr:MAG: Hsp20/alpha crystallin family protein [Candidatus Latescibacterota bacterium]
MEGPVERVERTGLVDREFHNIRELLELLMSEQSPTKQKFRMKPSLQWIPPADVYETETEFVVTMDIAGMDRNDISVFTDGKVITIRGVRSEVAPKGQKVFHKMEIRVGPFQRHIEVPVPVDSHNIHTDYSNGLLEVRLKKKFEPPEKRQIEVE